MAWNESGNGRNPWDRGGERRPAGDLDRIVRDWQQKLSALFGRGRGGTPGSPAGATPGLAGLALLILAGWLSTGIYRVDAAERAVILRFGKYQSTSQPGIGWHLPWPIERHETVNINEISPFNLQTRMLTSDENIVVVDLVVQYRKADPVKFLFNVRDAQGTLSDVSESAIREVIGKSKMDYALGEGRAEIKLRTQALIQQTLDEYGTGIVVTNANLQDVNFPDQVEAAVQDAIKAREDKERLSFEAQAYANDVVPKARGGAARQLADAEAYKARVTANAQGDVARFEQLLTEYDRAPAVTRERLYIDAMEDILGRSGKVILDTAGSGNMLYLPLDKIMEGRPSSAAPAARTPGTTVEAEAETPAARSRDENRARGGR